MRDLSSGGARLLVSGTIPLPHRFDLVIDSRHETRPVEIAWRADDATGVRYLDEASESDDAAGLRASLKASRAEAARLRARLAAIELGGRAANERLH